MKNPILLLIVLLIQPFAGQAMLKKYEDWIVEREAKLYKEYADSNYSGDFEYRKYDLSQLDNALDHQVKRNVLIEYFATPIIGIAAATLLTIKLAK